MIRRTATLLLGIFIGLFVAGCEDASLSSGATGGEQDWGARPNLPDGGTPNSELPVG